MYIMKSSSPWVEIWRMP